MMRSSISCSHESGFINTTLFGAYARRREINTLERLHLEYVGERAYMALSSIVQDPCTVVPIQPVQPPPTSSHLSLSTTVKTAIAPDRRHKTKHGNPSFCLLSLDTLFKRYCSDFRLEEQPRGRIMTVHDSCDQASCSSCTFHATTL